MNRYYFVSLVLNSAIVAPSLGCEYFVAETQSIIPGGMDRLIEIVYGFSRRNSVDSSRGSRHRGGVNLPMKHNHSRWNGSLLDWRSETSRSESA